MHLLRRIERHLRKQAIPPTKFGRQAVGDPRFVEDLRNGREPRIETERKVHAFLDQQEGGIAQ